MKTIRNITLYIFILLAVIASAFTCNSIKAVDEYENLTDRKEYLKLCGMRLTESDSLKLSRVNWLTKKISDYEKEED